MVFLCRIFGLCQKNYRPDSNHQILSTIYGKFGFLYISGYQWSRIPFGETDCTEELQIMMYDNQNKNGTNKDGDLNIILQRVYELMGVTREELSYFLFDLCLISINFSKKIFVIGRCSVQIPTLKKYGRYFWIRNRRESRTRFDRIENCRPRNISKKFQAQKK
jgi:hypothetical protein